MGLASRVFTLLCVVGGIFFPVAAQPPSIAAVLEVMSGQVEMQRAGTSQWFTIQTEGVIGSGDTLRTNFTGRARITFFDDGTEVILEPNSILQVDDLRADADDFVIDMNLVIGQSIHRLQRGLGVDSRYEIDSNFGVVSAEGTEFALRLKSDGQFSFISFENTISATRDAKSVDVTAGFGARIEVYGQFSDVVRASTFAQLDAALDGCVTGMYVLDNRLMPVYDAPSEDGNGLGTKNAAFVGRVFGMTEDSVWYRIPFDGGFGWVKPVGANVSVVCAGVREFEADFVEDAANITAEPDVEGWGFCVGETPIPSGWEPYPVKEGESLLGLALQTADRVPVARLQQVNCIADPSFLLTGMDIYLPPLN